MRDFENLKILAKKLESANEVGEKNESHLVLALDLPVTLVAFLSLYLIRVALKVASQGRTWQGANFL